MSFTKEDTKIIKGLAILMMLYHHLFTFPDRIDESIKYFPLFNIGEYTSSYLLGQFGNLCVVIFIFLAGYGTYLSCNKTDSISKKIFVKLKGLYKSYWRVLLIFFPICVIFNAPIAKSLEAFIWNLTGIFITCNGEWWFFTPYVILQLLYPLIKRIIDRKNSNFLTDIVFTIILSAIITYVYPTFLSSTIGQSLSDTIFLSALSNTLKLLSGFLMGCLFAKYNILSRLKNKLCNNYAYIILAIIGIIFVFYMRFKTNEKFDFVYAPIFIICSCIIFNIKIMKPVRFVLSEIGKEGTTIWLVHSFYCYTLLQKVVYLPKYSILIAIWLTIMSFVTAKLINIFYGGIEKGFGWFSKKLAINK